MDVFRFLRGGKEANADPVAQGVLGVLAATDPKETVGQFTERLKTAGIITAQATDDDEEMQDEEEVQGEEDEKTQDEEEEEVQGEEEEDEEAQGDDDDEITQSASSAKRIEAIITSKDARGREALAQNLAFTTDMPVKTALATLRAAPKAGKSLPERMKDNPNPKLRDEAAGGAQKSEVQETVDFMMAARDKKNGGVRKKGKAA